MSELPRRICIDKFTPAEKAIYDALGEVEKVGADTRLTDAVVLLQQAREKVADYIDGVNPIDPSIRAKEEDSFGAELGRLLSEFDKACKENEMTRASIAMNSIWVLFQVMSTACVTDLKELTYLKVPFHFDNGGMYLLTFVHVDGPKIQLKQDSGSAYTKSFEEIK
jgi:hypothetical protein